jgi:hypothetical protein
LQAITERLIVVHLSDATGEVLKSFLQESDEMPSVISSPSSQLSERGNDCGNGRWSEMFFSPFKSISSDSLPIISEIYPIQVEEMQFGLDTNDSHAMIGFQRETFQPAPVTVDDHPSTFNLEAIRSNPLVAFKWDEDRPFKIDVSFIAPSLFLVVIAGIFVQFTFRNNE